MMQTLIGADKVMLTLSGRIEIEASAFGNTVVQSYPGIGLKAQRVCFDGLKVLDVETLPEIDYANYPKPKNPALLQHFGIAPQDLADRWG